MAVITLKQLVAAGACKDQVELFRKHFGTEVRVTIAGARKVASLFDWDWAAEYLLSPSGYDKYRADSKLLYDKYRADRKPLDDKYQADIKLLYDKYRADRKPLDDKYQADIKPLDDKYRTGCAPVFVRLYNVKANRR